MATEQDYQSLLDRVAALRAELANRLSPNLMANPQLGEAFVKQIDDLLASAVAADEALALPPDKGLAALVGIGPDAAPSLGSTHIPQGVAPYDETVAS